MDILEQDAHNVIGPCQAERWASHHLQRDHITFTSPNSHTQLYR